MTSPLITPPIPALEALAALREGNQRFVANVRSIDALASHARRAALTDHQSPKAIILSCSDSRVPSEMVFDCGLGDLFVVRVAGNVCAPSLVGSVEFAASTFGTELVVVMGHTGCGAVKATIDALGQSSKGAPISDNIRDIVERIAPAVSGLRERGLAREELLRMATRANVVHTANQLRRGSRVLEERIRADQLVVVGAEYALETGEVDVFDLPAHLPSVAA